MEIQIYEAMLKRHILVGRTAPLKQFYLGPSLYKTKNFRVDGFQLKDDNGTTILLRGQRMPDKSLSFRADGQLSLEALRGFMPTVEDSFGMATVEARLTGSIDDPDLRLDFLVEDASMRLDFFPHPLEHISSKIKIVPSRYTIESFTANLGGGSYDMRGFVSSSMLYPKKCRSSN